MSQSLRSYLFFPFMSVNASLVFVPKHDSCGMSKWSRKRWLCKAEDAPSWLHLTSWHRSPATASKRWIQEMFSPLLLQIPTEQAICFEVLCCHISLAIAVCFLYHNVYLLRRPEKIKVYGWMFAPAVCFLLLRHVTVSRFFFRNGISATISFNKWRASLQSLS